VYQWSMVADRVLHIEWVGVLEDRGVHAEVL